MRFFNIDQHISVVADLKKIFSDLGHTIDDVCLSGHASVMGRQRDSVPMLDGDKWCGFVQRHAWNEFFETYPDLDQYDGFICCYPPIFSYLYKRYNKPIIIDIPIRYEYPCQSSAKDWNEFNEYLREGISEKKIHLVANNLYDAKYTEAFLGQSVEHIPSICEYTNAMYARNKNVFLYYSAKPFNEFAGTNVKRKHDELKFGHTWQEVAEYAGIIHFPYNISTMSTFEQYTANIPIFCPSINFILELYKTGLLYRVLEQTSWNATFGRPSGSVIKPLINVPDPNDFADIDSVKYWLKYADYYNNDVMPDIIQFDSFEDLKRKLIYTDLDSVSNCMKITNAKNKELVYSKWEKILQGL